MRPNNTVPHLLRKAQQYNSKKNRKRLDNQGFTKSVQMSFSCFYCIDRRHGLVPCRKSGAKVQLFFNIVLPKAYFFSIIFYKCSFFVLEPIFCPSQTCEINGNYAFVVILYDPCYCIPNPLLHYFDLKNNCRKIFLPILGAKKAKYMFLFL